MFLKETKVWVGGCGCGTRKTTECVHDVTSCGVVQSQVQLQLGVYLNLCTTSRHLFEGCMCVNCNAMQYSTIQYNELQYNTIQWTTIQYNTIQWTAMQYNPYVPHTIVVKKTWLQVCRSPSEWHSMTHLPPAWFKQRWKSHTTMFRHTVFWKHGLLMEVRLSVYSYICHNQSTCGSTVDMV